MNPKQEQPNEIQAKTHHSQTSERQRQKCLKAVALVGEKQREQWWISH